MATLMAEDRMAEVDRKLELILEELGQMRNVRNSAQQQLDSAVDFIADAQPIVKDLFKRAVDGCQTMQQRGYFDAAAAGVKIGDALIASHRREDWQQVQSSVPQLVGFLRELTRPEVLGALEAIIHGFGRVQATMNVDKSAFELVRDMNSPDARRGMAILVEFLKVVGSRAATGVAAATSN